jgi:hypothetical protein
MAGFYSAVDTFTGLDAFGAGESVTVSFVVPSYNGP